MSSTKKQLQLIDGYINPSMIESCRFEELHRRHYLSFLHHGFSTDGHHQKETQRALFSHLLTARGDVRRNLSCLR